MTLMLTGCGSKPERPGGLASVVQGQSRVSAAGGRWEARSQPLRLRGGEPPQLTLVSGVPGRRLVYLKQPDRRRYTYRLLGETFTRALTVAGDAHRPVVSGTRWAATTVERVPGGLRGYEMTLFVGDVSSGRVLRRLSVARAQDLEYGEVAISPRGDVAVLWFRPRPGRDGTGDFPDAVVSVLGAGQRSLSPAQVLTRDVPILNIRPYYHAAMAFGPDGDLVIAEDDTDLRVRVRSAGGTLGARRRVTGRVDVLPVVTADGRVIIAWLQSRNEAVLATARLRGGPFGRPQPLRTGGGGVADRITSLKQVSNTVAWSTKTQTWIADVRADGRLGPRHTRAGELEALATAPDGRVLVVTDVGHERLLRAHLRPAGAATFEAPEPIPGTANAFDVLAEFAPRTGAPVVTVQYDLPSHRPALTTAARR
jgi:hypothetical protein